MTRTFSPSSRAPLPLPHMMLALRSAAMALLEITRPADDEAAAA